MRILLAVLLVSAGIGAAAPGGIATEEAAPAPCGDGETVVFHCEMEAKTVSLCAIPAQDAIRYRTVEAGDARDIVLASGTFRLSTVAYAGGGEARIRFVHGNHEYSVFDRTVRTGFGDDGHNAPDFGAGLVDTTADGASTTSECGNAASITSYAYAHLEREDFAEAP